jgi:hypothetical protein
LSQSQQTAKIQKGLSLIKYASAKDISSPPIVIIRQAPGCELLVELILPSDTQEPILWSPGGCLIAKATRPAQLLVQVVPADRSGGSVDATIEFLHLTSDPAGAQKVSSTLVPMNMASFRLLGHVAGLGDVIVGADDWIAGPKAPARVEGVSIDWPDMPKTLGLRYSAKIGGQRPVTTAFVEAGQYVGTRGRALPLIGLTIELTGIKATKYCIVSDAIFQGSPLTRVSGRCVVLAAPTGREALLGLRVAIEGAPVENDEALPRLTSV